MLTIEEAVSDKLIEVRLSGKLTREAYEAFVPATEEYIQQRGKVRMLVIMEGFQGWESGAAWEDTKFAYRHFRDIERLVMVGESQWEKWMTTFCRPFTMAKVKYFDVSEIDQARQWIVKEHVPLHHHVLKSERILVLQPEEALTESDFKEVADQIDPVIESLGPLNGVLIQVSSFPGWENFSSMMAHFRFVKNHHKDIQRVALVTDDRVASRLPSMVNHFVAAEARHFPPDEKANALDWLLSGE